MTTTDSEPLRWRWARAFRDKKPDGLSAMEQAVAWQMHAYADMDGAGIYPSQELLAKKTHLSVSSVKRARRVLEDAHVFVKVSGASPGRSAEYKLGEPNTWQDIPDTDVPADEDATVSDDTVGESSPPVASETIVSVGGDDSSGSPENFNRSVEVIRGVEENPCGSSKVTDDIPPSFSRGPEAWAELDEESRARWRKRPPNPAWVMRMRREEAMNVAHP